MDDATFWSYIDRAREGDASADPDRLRTILKGEADATVAAFGERLYGELAGLNRWSLWGAAYVAQGGASDDGFFYFREWLVGKGKAAVAQALADPDGLGPYLSADPEANENEGLGWVAVEVLEERGVEEPEASWPKPEGEPAGERFEEETVAEVYPRLAAAFG